MTLCTVQTSPLFGPLHLRASCRIFGAAAHEFGPRFHVGCPLTSTTLEPFCFAVCFYCVLALARTSDRLTFCNFSLPRASSHRVATRPFSLVDSACYWSARAWWQHSLSCQCRALLLPCGYCCHFLACLASRGCTFVSCRMALSVPACASTLWSPSAGGLESSTHAAPFASHPPGRP